MREVKLIKREKVNILDLITNKFKEMNLTQYYMKKFRREKETTYFFVYETSYTTLKQVKFFSRLPGKIIVSTSIVATVRPTDTVVSFVISTDDDVMTPNAVILTLFDNGFKKVE